MGRLRKPDFYSIRVIERAIQVLNCFSFNQKEYTLGELSQETKLSKSTIFRILQTLEKNKFISHNSLSNKYSLGMKLFELGGIIFSSLSLRKTASRFLDLLEAKTNHSILLGILDEGELVYIDKREGNDNIKVNSEIGKRRPPYFGMLGKTLMAYLADEEVDKLLRRYPLQKFAPLSITNPEKFKTSLKEIREKGYTYEYNEAWEGIIGIAVPIRNYMREVVAAIGIGVPVFPKDDEKIKETISLVIETAKEISEALGFNEIQKV